MGTCAFSSTVVPGHRVCKSPSGLAHPHFAFLYLLWSACALGGVFCFCSKSFLLHARGRAFFGVVSTRFQTRCSWLHVLHTNLPGAAISIAICRNALTGSQPRCPLRQANQWPT